MDREGKGVGGEKKNDSGEGGEECRAKRVASTRGYRTHLGGVFSPQPLPAEGGQGLRPKGSSCTGEGGGKKNGSGRKRKDEEREKMA